MRIMEGKLVSQAYRIALVVSRFNELISRRLLDGAVDCLLRHGVNDEDLTVLWVPGALEIPRIAQEAARRQDIDAVICLGAVIRGGTPHFKYVSAEVSKGVAQLALSSSKPVIFGVLTTDTLEQALERAGAKGGNRGCSAAAAALEMLNLLAELDGTKA